MAANSSFKPKSDNRLTALELTLMPAPISANFEALSYRSSWMLEVVPSLAEACVIDRARVKPLLCSSDERDTVNEQAQTRCLHNKTLDDKQCPGYSLRLTTSDYRNT